MALEKDFRDFKAVEGSTAFDWHVFWVFHDADFITDISKLNKACGIVPQHSVMGPPSFDKFVPAKMLSKFHKMSKAIMEKYCITMRQIEAFNNRPIDYKEHVPYNIVRFRWHPNGDFAMRLTKDATKKDLMKCWQFMQEIRGAGLVARSRIRRKPPDNTELIYAIFKARLNDLAFEEIFSMYKGKNLYSYSGKINARFEVADDLEKFYNLYRPDR